VRKIAEGMTVPARSEAVSRQISSQLFYVADAKPEKIEIITPQGEKVTPPPFALV
jgi:hypothetical protein